MKDSKGVKECSLWFGTQTPGVWKISIKGGTLFAMLEERLKNHVRVLSYEIGERNYIIYNALERSASYIKKTFESYDYRPVEQTYSVGDRVYRNIIATKVGKYENSIIVCAHYDSVSHYPGADDNASGVSGMLELSRLFSQETPKKTIKFIAFTNEEPPWFRTRYMGSYVYAREAKNKKEKIEEVLCLESIGFYSNKEGSQSYPLLLYPFYPKRGNFIAVVSNLFSIGLVRKIVEEFKKHSSFPIEHLSAPVLLFPEIGLSDNWSFWQFDYKAVMITDTAFYRNPYYHTPKDTYNRLDYKSMAEVVRGLYRVLLKLSN